MKQIFITVLLVVTGFINKANASDASPLAVAAFQKQFVNAKEVLWEDFGTLYKVSFAQEGKYASAFYNADGHLVTMFHNLSLTDLPKNLKASAQKMLDDQWISELVYMTSQEEKAYYMTLENADTKMIMKSVNNKKWVVYQSLQK